MNLNLQAVAGTRSSSPLEGGSERLRAEQTAAQFEQVLVQSLVTEMRKTGGADKMFGEGPGSDVYGQWFDQVMSERLSAGGAFGIADSVLASMERVGQLKAAPVSNAPERGEAVVVEAEA